MPGLATQSDASGPRDRPGLGELVDAGTLAVRAAAVAADQSAPLTRHTYAGVYRAFCAFVGPAAAVDALTRETVRAFHDDVLEKAIDAATRRRRGLGKRTYSASGRG